jgi:hypothetical protein
MQQLLRRRLLKLAGLGTVLAAGGSMPAFRGAAFHPAEVFHVRATLGVPESPLPSYATYVIEGSLNLARGTGLLASRVLAGHPGAASEIGLPGLGRMINITGVEEHGAQLTVRGLIEDRSQLQPGESYQVQVVIDRARGVVQAPFGSKSVALTLA